MIWVLLLGAILAFAFWMWWGTGSVANRLDHPHSIMQMLEYLMNRGIDGSQLHFRVRHSAHPRFVFTKYFDGCLVGIRASLSHKYTAEAAIDAFTTLLRGRGAQVEQMPDNRGSLQLYVDFGRDLGAARLAVDDYYSTVASVSSLSEGVAYFKNVITYNAPDLTGVDAPD